MRVMGRIDIVVFPNGGRDIFGQINGAGSSSLVSVIDEFLASLDSSDTPRKFTGYYDQEDASDIEWLPYDENNPIVQVDKADLGIPYDIEAGGGVPSLGDIPQTISVEFAQIPAEQRDKYLPNFTV